MSRLTARLTVLVLFAAAPPAFAACGSTTVNIYRGGQTFVCYPNCRVAGGSAHALRSFSFVEPDSTGGFVAATNQCYAECARTPGCTGIQFSDWYEWPKGYKGPTGRHHMTCTLLGGVSTASMADYTPSGPRSGGADSWVCRPQIGVREPDSRIDTDRFFQDQYRPSVPSPSPPTKP
jgi:hypothetical protein